MICFHSCFAEFNRLKIVLRKPQFYPPAQSEDNFTASLLLKTQIATQFLVKKCKLFSSEPKGAIEPGYLRSLAVLPCRRDTLGFASLAAGDTGGTPVTGRKRGR